MADFAGGIQSRRLPVLWVVLFSQAVGLAAVALALAARGSPPPELSRLLPAAAAGVAGLAGLAAFYRGLAIGTMSIVAPIAASGMCLPVAVGIVGGDRPGATQLAGMVAAGVGVALASREPGSAVPGDRRAARLSIALALVAALGFGAFALGLRSSARADVVWALAAARGACVIPLLIAVVAAGRGGRPSGARLLPIAMIGLLDVSANGLFAVATRHGLLSVVAVGSSLYPVVTVLLARLVLGERVARGQEAGVVAVLLGVVAIAAG